MGEEIKTDGLSISDAFDKGMEATQKEGNSPAEGNKENGSPEEDDEGAAPIDGGKPGEAGESSDDPEEIDEEGKPVVKLKEPVIDPDNGKYEGEYTKDRFDGLMSKWQQERALLNDPEKLKAHLSKMGINVGNKEPDKPKENSTDIEIPEELKNADAESQEGFKLVMKGVLGHLSKIEQNILGKVVDIVNKPLREETETTSKIQSEISDLKVTEGKLFADNQKEIVKYAADNDYPLGTLKLAFKAWRKEQELTGRINKLSKGKEVIDEIEEEEKSKAMPPKNSKGVGASLPQFDPERDGNKTPEDIWSEVAKVL